MNHAFSLMLLLTATAWAGTESRHFSLISPLTKTDDQIAYLQLLAKVYPNFFTEALTYEYDLESMIDFQNKAIRTLSKMPGYKTTVLKQPDLIEIQVTNSNTGSSSEAHLTDATLKNWNSKLSQLHASQNIVLLSSQLENFLKEKIPDTKKTSKNALGGLIASLPTDLKQKLSAAGLKTREDKLKWIENSIQALPNNFQYQIYGYSEKPTLAQFLLDAETQNQQDSSVQSLLILGTQRFAGPGLNEQQILALKDPDYWSGFLDQSPLLKNAKPFIPEILALMKGWGLEYETVKTSGRKFLKIVEIPPYIAMARSCAGGDCATSRALLYPYAPEEKVFLLIDEAGQNLGYTQGTLMKQGNQSVLYLHTINGLKLKGQDVDLILAGLDQAKDKIGFKAIHLPMVRDADSEVLLLKDYNNFPSVLNRLTEFSLAGTPSGSLHYENANFRQAIQNIKGDFNDLTLDHVNPYLKSNRILDSDLAQMKASLLFKIMPSKTSPLINQVKAKMEDLLDLVLIERTQIEMILYPDKQNENLNFIQKYLGLSESDLTPLYQAIRSPTGKKFIDYQNDISNEWNHLRSRYTTVPVDEKRIEVVANQFAYACSDTLENGRAQKSLTASITQTIKDMLEREKINLDEYKTEISELNESLKTLATDPKSAFIIIKLMRDGKGHRLFLNALLHQTNARREQYFLEFLKQIKAYEALSFIRSLLFLREHPQLISTYLKSIDHASPEIENELFRIATKVEEDRVLEFMLAVVIQNESKFSRDFLDRIHANLSASMESEFLHSRHQTLITQSSVRTFWNYENISSSDLVLSLLAPSDSNTLPELKWKIIYMEAIIQSFHPDKLYAFASGLAAKDMFTRYKALLDQLKKKESEIKKIKNWGWCLKILSGLKIK